MSKRAFYSEKRLQLQDSSSDNSRLRRHCDNITEAGNFATTSVCKVN